MTADRKPDSGVIVARPAFIGSVHEGARETCRIRSTGEPLGEVLELTRSAALRRFVVYHERLPPGRRASSPHAHSHKEEHVFVLSGSLHVSIDGELYPLTHGDYVNFAAATGIVHYILNNGAEAAEYLMVASIEEDDVVDYAVSKASSPTEGRTD